MATLYKIKLNGKIIAQADRPSIAAYLALSYNAEVNYDNRTTVWNPAKERRGWLQMTQNAVDELAEIITERVEQYKKEADARYYKKMRNWYEERNAERIANGEKPLEATVGTKYGTQIMEAK